MLVKKMICFMLVCSLVFLTACWDQVAIEDRGFVVGVAIDMGEEGGEQDKDNYTLNDTTQIVVPAGFGSPAQGGGGKAFTNITASGTSMFGISNEIAEKTSRIPYYEHLKVLVVSAALAKESGLFASVMDLFIRDAEMRGSIKIAISSEEAKSIMEIKPNEEKLSAIYIDSVLENGHKTIEIVDPVTMGDIHGHLLDLSSYVIPKVKKAGESKMVSSGVAVFNGYDNKMVGTLNGQETKGLNLVNNTVKGGLIQFEIDNNLMVFEIEKAKPSVKIDVQDKNNMTISVDIDMKGRIAEMFGSSTLLTPGRFKKIEELVNKKAVQLANHTIKKAQEELHADIFGFGENLNKHHYDTWQKIKGDWDHGDNLFSKAKINVTVNTIVRTTTETDKTKRKGSE